MYCVYLKREIEFCLGFALVLAGCGCANGRGDGVVLLPRAARWHLPVITRHARTRGQAVVESSRVRRPRCPDLCLPGIAWQAGRRFVSRGAATARTWVAVTPAGHGEDVVMEAASTGNPRPRRGRSGNLDPRRLPGRGSGRRSRSCGGSGRRP